jgi:hypothetical protein
MAPAGLFCRLSLAWCVPVKAARGDPHDITMPLRAAYRQGISSGVQKLPKYPKAAFMGSVLIPVSEGPEYIPLASPEKVSRQPVQPQTGLPPQRLQLRSSPVGNSTSLPSSWVQKSELPELFHFEIVTDLRAVQ